MKMTSSNSRTASLKTYSRRDNTTTERPSGKRKLSEESQSVVELPPARKIARCSIQSYFQPLSKPSSPAPTRSPAFQSSDSLEPPSTPPSSPPPESIRPTDSTRKSQKRPKRRLSAKPKHLPLATMSNAPITTAAVQAYGIHGMARNPATALPLTNIPQATVTQSFRQTTFLTNKGKVSCDLCDMIFDKSVAEDILLHRLHHEEYLSCGSRTVDLASVTINTTSVSSHPAAQQGIIRIVKIDKRSTEHIDKRISDKFRIFIGRVLVKVNEDLGYEINTAIDENEVYITLVGAQPVAVIVVEGETLGSPCTLKETRRDGVVILERDVSRDLRDTRHVDVLVDRLWVHKDFRGHGFATRLLHEVLNNHGLAKDEVAFSSPTSSGYEFACRYFAGVFEPIYPNRDVKFLVDYSEVANMPTDASTT